MSNYTTLYLDLDNTLFDFLKTENKAIKKVLKKHKLPCDEKTAQIYSAINKKWWESFEKREIKKEEIFTGRFKELLSFLKREGNPDLIRADYFNALSSGHHLIKGARPLLKALKKAGLTLIATTNGVSTTQYKRIKEAKIGKYFDYIFVSEEVGCQKPEKAYFDYVLANSPEKNKSKILIIGDSQSSDILGGINAGIDTCFYNPNGIEPIYKSKYEIKNLKEAKRILKIS